MDERKTMDGLKFTKSNPLAETEDFWLCAGCKRRFPPTEQCPRCPDCDGLDPEVENHG